MCPLSSSIPAQVQKVAGGRLDADKLAGLLDEDFDPEKFDAAMGTVFDDEYFEGDDDFDPRGVRVRSQVPTTTLAFRPSSRLSVAFGGASLLFLFV